MTTREEGAAVRRVVFVNRFYYPDISATAQLLTDVATAMAARGFAVTVVTSAALYEGGARLPARDRSRGVEIRRVAAFGSGRGGLPVRLATILGFYILAGLALLRVLRRHDVLVVKTDPPLFLVVAAVAARLRGARRVNWLQDLYPEVAAELGVRVARGRTGALLAGLRDRAVRTAFANVAIGERMAALLGSRGVDPARIEIIPNWTDDDVIAPLAEAPPQRREWNLAGRFVIGYSGNLGRAHDVDTVLGAALHYRAEQGVRFLFVGGGALRAQLERESARHGLTNIVWRPYQPRERLRETLAMPDVHWISLAPALEGLIVPSKLYGIMAAGKPFIFVGAADGEVARVARDHDCGLVVSPGDVGGFVAAVEALRRDQGRAQHLGANGRRAIEDAGSKATALARWSALLGRATAS